MNNQIRSYNSTIRAMTMAIIALLLLPQNSSAQTAAYSQFTLHKKAGLSISLPKELSRLSEKKHSYEMGTLETYTAVHETRSVLIKHFRVSPDMKFTPAQSADVQEKDIKNQPRYSSSRKKVSINGINGLVLVMKYEPMAGTKVSQTILYFEKGNEMWEVQIFGVKEPNAASLEAMRTKIFKSVKIVN